MYFFSLGLEGCLSFLETPCYYMNELSPITCFENEAPVFEHLLECIFEFQCVWKTHWSKHIQKHVQKQGPHFQNMLVPKHCQWIVQ